MTSSSKITIKETVPTLAATWLSTYLEALKDGLRAKPSGEWTTDVHCRAAAVLATYLDGSFWPKIYGGTRPLRDRSRWSAPRRACLKTFEHGIKLGLPPAQAARAMRKARKLAMERLGIHEDSKTSIEDWMALSLDQRAREVARHERDRALERLRSLVSIANAQTPAERGQAWIGPGEGYPDYIYGRAAWGGEFAEVPLSTEDQRRRDENVARVNDDLVKLANLYLTDQGDLPDVGYEALQESSTRSC